MRINFFVSMFILVCLVTCTATQFNYRQYHQQWLKVVPPELVIDVSTFASQQQKCGIQSCQFYYYLYENANLTKEASRNRTVLLVSGLEGDELLAPNLLLKSYGKIAAARIIYFPLANPSGFMQGTKTTFPNLIDILKDIPINNNIICNRTSAFKIIERLYLQYSIDLSIFVHEGTSIISYPWTKDKNNKNILKTSDQQLYGDITNMLQVYDKQYHPIQHKLKGKQVDNTGTLIDWAYGASHYPNILSKSCSGKTFPKYPNSTMNGLVFSVGLGLTNKSKTTKQQTNNFLQRGLTILVKLFSLVNPKIAINIKDRNVTVFIEGCKIGFLSYLKIVDSKGKIILQKTDETIVRGDVTGEQISPSLFQTEVKLPSPFSITYEAKFKCGSGWIGQGRTTFAKTHEYMTYGQVNTFGQAQTLWQISYQMVLAVILLIIAIVWGINCVRTGMKLRRARRISQFNQKFQQIEYVEDVDAYETSLSPKGQEGHDDRFNMTE